MPAKSLKIGVQMDALETVNINGDSTFIMMVEAQARGYELWHYLATDLAYDEGRVTAHARPVTVRQEVGNHFSAGATERIDLSTMDVILMRQDPPFDMQYITATHLLELIHPQTLVVNDPASVRNAPEKLFTTLFDGLMPPTLITHREEDIKAFRERHGDIIIKPLYGNGGVGVFHVKPDDPNLDSLLEIMLAGREPVIAQLFLPEVKDGDKRIVLIDGEVAGAINRIPAVGSVRSNMVVGGKAEKSTLSPREEEICRTLGPTLKEMGLLFVGIDVIGNWLTEINVTSPTGIQAINRYDGVALEQQLWTAIESKLR